MKRRLIQTVQSILVAGCVTAAELLLVGLYKLVFSSLSAPALWVLLFDFGGTTAFALVTCFAGKRDMQPFEKLLLMILPMLISAVNVSQLFPLASAWGFCFTMELLGAAFGGAFAGCIQISGEQSRLEERYTLAVREP